MLFEFWKEYRNWKKEHRSEVQEARRRKELLKHDLNYVELESWMTAFINENQKDAVLEIKGRDFTVKMYFDDKGQVVRKTTTQQILDEYNQGV